MQVCVHAAVVYRMHWQVIVPATDKDIQKRRKVELRRVCETQALYEAVTWTEVSKVSKMNEAGRFSMIFLCDQKHQYSWEKTCTHDTSNPNYGDLKRKPSFLWTTLLMVSFWQRHDKAQIWRCSNHPMITEPWPSSKKNWVWINTYENTIISGMNIHKSQLFWCEQKRVLTHPQVNWKPTIPKGFWNRKQWKKL